STAGAGRLEQYAQALVAEGLEHAERVALEREQRAELGALDRPLYELPALAGGIDLGALYELAGRLTDQGMA
ncbi:MAG: ATPase, partial [Kineosporiaceae bacterium]